MVGDGRGELDAGALSHPVRGRSGETVRGGGSLTLLEEVGAFDSTSSSRRM